MKFKTPYNSTPTKGEVNNQPSMTIPDQTMTVREIMDRYSRGLPIDGQKVPIYDEEDDMPDIRTLDLAERQELKEQAEYELADIKNRLNQKKQQKQQKNENPPNKDGDKKDE